ncbi:MAG: response regulator [Anaerolineae bacterium]|jgi:CheY-like chemotaxis protein|nr:response regulator [Anaerolineae bacterium]
MSSFVLLIEDSEEFASIVRETLRRIHIEVLHARDGQTAHQMLTQYRPKVILLDINLPDMTGWNVIDLFKPEFEALPPEERPRIIVLTAYNDAANRLVGKLQEVHRFLVKTTTPQELQQVVREALGA